VLTAGVSLFHWRGLQPGYTFLPVDLAKTILPWGDGAPRVLQNWLISDPLYQFYPFLTQAVASVQRGEWLLWNPNILLGHPAAADPLFQTFYPFLLPFGLLFGPGRGYALALYAHALLAACLMYGLLRSLRVSPAGSVTGAFTYALSGYLVTWFEFSFWVTTLAWLPGVLCAYALAVRRRSWRYVALGGLCLGLALLAGQVQFVAVFAGYLLASLLAYLLLTARLAHWDWWPLGAWGVITGLGLLIGAVQIVMLADFLPLTTRTGGYGSTGLPISQLTALLLPNFFGNPSRSDYWGAGNFNESTIYVGAVAWLLAAIAVWSAATLLRSPHPQVRVPTGTPSSRDLVSSFHPALVAVVAAAAAVVALLYLLVGGPGTSLLAALPLVNQIPLSRYAFLLPLLVGTLAGIGLDRDRTPPSVAAWAALALCGLGALLAAAFWNAGIAANLHLLWEDAIVAGLLLAVAVGTIAVRTRRPQWRTPASWVLVGLIFANLFWFGRAYNPVGHVDDLFGENATIPYLQEHAGGARVVGLQRGPVLFGPNLLGRFGLHEPSGYSSLVPARYQQLLAVADPELDSRLANRASNHLLFSYPPARLLDMLGVRYMAASEEIFDPGPQAEFVRTDCAAATAVITAEAPLSGTFDVWRTAINRLDLQFAPLPDGIGGDPGALMLRIWRGAEGDNLFVEAPLAVADIAAVPLQTVYFAPQVDAPGQTYRWRIDAQGADGAGVRLCTDARGLPALSLYGAQLSEVHREDDVRIYERFTAFPRAAVVYAAQVITDDAAAMTQILDPNFDLRNTVVSSSPLPISPVLPAVPPQAAQPAEIAEEQNQRIVVRATAAAPGVLVLADQYAPGWEAHVDGVATPIVRVNTILRGLPLAPGAHEIVFAYRPPALGLGAALSFIGLTLAVAIFVFGRRRSP
jgi:hypothetical protein